jgi:DNA polymerase-1
MPTIALMDGDIFAYEIAAGAEEPIHWGDGLWTLHAWEEPAKAKLEGRIEELGDSIGADRIIVAISDDANWRKDVLPTYKENRNGQRKPMLLKILKDHLAENYETFVRPSLEADDVLGILSTWKKLKGDKVIVTKDKDLQTIPGLHYLSHKEERGVFEVTEDEADLWHLIQTLSGDVTDGYKGCPGIGAVRAEKALKDLPPEERWPKVVELFEKAGLGEDEALTQARVARICRASDYDFKKKEVKLWTP